MADFYVDDMAFLESLMIPPYTRTHGFDPATAIYTRNNVEGALKAMDISPVLYDSAIEQLLGKGVLVENDKAALMSFGYSEKMAGELKIPGIMGFSITPRAIIRYLSGKYNIDPAEIKE
ncbi:TPA: hypothetical protein HA239_06315 [Candidatus Woesearchaeota archaeon]|nr:hypothetical protein QT06_C0001G0860 [archaeon GW2011_AR15]MBS3103361.1 hypothetical protein [Candidatus Woesearchaeota archaeon]HIH41989.1 hypothetical protein [Candidatus Woesearchaeota archaeon]